MLKQRAWIALSAVLGCIVLVWGSLAVLSGRSWLLMQNVESLKVHGFTVEVKPFDWETAYFGAVFFSLDEFAHSAEAENATTVFVDSGKVLFTS